MDCKIWKAKNISSCSILYCIYIQLFEKSLIPNKYATENILNIEFHMSVTFVIHYLKYVDVC